MTPLAQDNSVSSKIISSVFPPGKSNSFVVFLDTILSVRGFANVVSSTYLGGLYHALLTCFRL